MTPQLKERFFKRSIFLRYFMNNTVLVDQQLDFAVRLLDLASEKEVDSPFVSRALVQGAILQWDLGVRHLVDELLFENFDGQTLAHFHRSNVPVSLCNLPGVLNAFEIFIESRHTSNYVDYLSELRSQKGSWLNILEILALSLDKRPKTDNSWHSPSPLNAYDLIGTSRDYTGDNAEDAVELNHWCELAPSDLRRSLLESRVFIANLRHMFNEC